MQRGDDLDNISHPKADFSGVDCFQGLLCEEPSSGAMSEEEIMMYRARPEPLKDTMFPSLFSCLKKQLFLITALRSLIDYYQLYAISRILRRCWRRLHTSTALKASKLAAYSLPQRTSQPDWLCDLTCGWAFTTAPE